MIHALQELRRRAISGEHPANGGNGATPASSRETASSPIDG
jgi:hypothetical protein